MSMLIGDLVGLESELSEYLVEPADLIAWAAEWISEAERECAATEGATGTKAHCDALRAMAGVARKRQELAALVSAYREAKRDLDAIDFGDQVALAAPMVAGAPEDGA